MRKYQTFLKKIVLAYQKIGFRPNIRVYFDFAKKECNPLLALLFAEQGIEPFLCENKQLSLKARRSTHKMFDFPWVEGFDDGFNLREIDSGWKSYSLHKAGYKVGIEIHQQLKEIYYKKVGPQAITDDSPTIFFIMYG